MKTKIRTKFILLVDETSDSRKYADERNMPLADTFTSPVELYDPTKDLISLKNGVWDRIEIHNLITGLILSKQYEK